jgi:hypothetical protein
MHRDQVGDASAPRRGGAIDRHGELVAVGKVDPTITE